MLEKPHGADLRKGRFSERGRVYLVTTVTHSRVRLFTDFALGRAVVACLRHQDLAGHTETLAFVVMPDHLHWLFVLGNTATLSTILKSVKNFSARRVNALRGNRGPVWQRGYHDHALRREEDLLQAARYVVANPLRAGLANRVGDYPLWDAKWL